MSAKSPEDEPPTPYLTVARLRAVLYEIAEDRLARESHVRRLVQGEGLVRTEDCRGVPAIADTPTRGWQTAISPDMTERFLTGGQPKTPERDGARGE